MWKVDVIENPNKNLLLFSSVDYTTYKISPKIDAFQFSSIQLLLLKRKGGSFSSQKNSVPLLKGEKSAKALGVTEVERKKHQGQEASS